MGLPQQVAAVRPARPRWAVCHRARRAIRRRGHRTQADFAGVAGVRGRDREGVPVTQVKVPSGIFAVTFCRLFARAPRSEEHTSELQSLMRISDAVFSLKKKTRMQSIQ